MDRPPQYGVRVSASALGKAEELAELFGMNVTELVTTLIEDLHRHEQAEGRLPARGRIIPWPGPRRGADGEM